MKFDESRPFGIEIEAVGIESSGLADELTAQGIPTRVEGYNHELRTHWKIVPDASVHGRFPFELVSPKLYGQDGLDEVKRVMKIVRELGGRVNASCGMHVHHSAQGLNGKQSRMVSHFYSALFPCFDGIFALSRRHSSWARLADPQAATHISDFDMRHGNRFMAVNLLALFKHGTIEFRQHQGTLNGTKATSWIVFTQQFMLGALRSKVKVSWRTKNLKVGLFNFWRLYDKDATIDEPCEQMLRFVAKRVGWKVGKIIAARNGHAPVTVGPRCTVAPTFTSNFRHALNCEQCTTQREGSLAALQAAEPRRPLVVFPSWNLEREGVLEGMVRRNRQNLNIDCCSSCLEDELEIYEDQLRITQREIIRGTVTGRLSVETPPMEQIPFVAQEGG